MVTLVCWHCKKDFDVKPYMARTAKCCSRSCQWHYTKNSREPNRLKAVSNKKAWNNKSFEINCINCSKPFLISPSRKNVVKFCKRSCYWEAVKVLTPTEHALRYKRITFNGKRMLEHRYIIEQHLGRKLLSYEHVHHKNHNKTDNRLDNLEIVSASTHSKMHHIKPF